MTDGLVHLPQGAFREADGTLLWRVWAPKSVKVTLLAFHPGHPAEIDMAPASGGYHVHRQEQAEDGLRYAYRLVDGRAYPDPASRWQPDGVHHPSAVFSPGRFVWTDDEWRGVPREDLAIYEIHVGAFTPEGTLDAIIPRLPALRELGVTAIEIMPVAQFPGERNWGYDGVHPYAVQASYGGPAALQRLVDKAHAEQLGVILDVVYNHFGPEGNYLAHFAPYFTDRYLTPWGSAVNFDGPDSDAVRKFVIDNARMWIRDFHLDGLRIDATHAIFDNSARHILAELHDAVHVEAAQQNRTVHVIAESNQNDPRLVQASDSGGLGLDGVWCDDFHHSVHALLTHERDTYYQDFGDATQLAKAYNDVFVYDGCYSPFHRRRHGALANGLDRTLFVVSVQNHDQIGNRALGDRINTLLPPPAQRLACALLLLSPYTPLVFMGEEYGEARPFPFFCSFSDKSLIENVQRCRCEEIAGRTVDEHCEHDADILDPQAPETFLSAKISWEWPAGSDHAGIRRLYAVLLAARRQPLCLRDRRQTAACLTSVAANGNGHASNDLLVLERGGPEGLIAIANLTPARQSAPAMQLRKRALVLSTEEARFGGRRLQGDPLELLHPYELQVFDTSEWPS